MFGDREIHRKLSGAGGYAAGRLAEISDSLGQLAKIMKNSGEDPGLSREDGIAALESAASMVCGSCDRCGMKQECLDEQDGTLFPILPAPRIRKKRCVGVPGHAQGVSGPVPEKDGLSQRIEQESRTIHDEPRLEEPVPREPGCSYAAV